MKYKILLVLLALLALLCSTYYGFSQEKVAVKQLFWDNYITDLPTANTLKKGTYNIDILHRFGSIENGFSDLFGVYAPSNISIGLDYGVTNKLTVHFSTEKNYKTQEFSAKYKLLTQNISNKYSMNLSYYTNVSINAMDKDNYGKDYHFINRLFYTNMLIASKQFNYKFNLSTSLFYSHFNKVEEGESHDIVGFNLMGGVKLWSNKSFFVTYSHPFSLDNEELNQQISFGLDVSGRVHQYQIFFTNQNLISPAISANYNTSKIEFKNLCLGFNIIIKINK